MNTLKKKYELDNALGILEKLIAQSYKIANKPYLDSSLFGWTQDLEANHPFILREVETILDGLEQGASFQHTGKSQRSIFLYEFGGKVEQNCARCPITTKLIENIPGMKTAFFSILAPGEHIPPHCGRNKEFIRYHFGIKVPVPNTQCGIKVDGETRHRSEGESLLFDATCSHEAWNNSDEIQVILHMDIIHPLTFAGDVLSNEL